MEGGRESSSEKAIFDVRESKRGIDQTVDQKKMGFLLICEM